MNYNIATELISKYTKNDIKALRKAKRESEITRLMQIRTPGKIREAQREIKKAKRLWTQEDMGRRMGLGTGTYKSSRARPAQTKRRISLCMGRAYARIEDNWGADIPMCLLVLYVLGEVPHE